MIYRPKTTLEQWRMLQAVVDYGGYAQAAEKLNKSQSSLNHAVAKLQGQLNLTLLEVKGRKAVLTDVGEVLLRRSRDLTDNVKALESLADNVNQGWEPEITVALDVAYPRHLLLPVLETFLADSRGSRLKIIDTVLTATEEAITQKWADIAITAYIPKGFLGEPITDVSFIPVCHPDHELANTGTEIDPIELQKHLQIVIKDNAVTPTDKPGWLKSESRWTVSDFDLAVEILLAKMGFCWLPEHYAKDYLTQGRLAQFKIKGSSTRKYIMSLVQPKQEQVGPGTKLLTSIFFDHKNA
jgi:DNA-binding transcriptional LysR family regulator